MCICIILLYNQVRKYTIIYDTIRPPSPHISTDISTSLRSPAYRSIYAVDHHIRVSMLMHD